MRHRLGTALACATLVVLTSCGSATAPPTSTRATPPTPTPTPTPTDAPTTPPSDAAQKIRVVGEVVQDGDCVAVEDDGGTTWTIAGEAAAGLSVGDRIQVTGIPDLAATGCAGPLVEALRVTTAR